jgi:type 1 glutamine amidotransferase
MGKPSALIVWGGWDGHEPDKVADLFRKILSEEGFEVEVSNTLDSFADKEKCRAQSLLIPIYTMSEISEPQFQGIYEAVKDYGVGLAGCHGGMCDAFRTHTEWQFMTGSQWVAHPGNDGVRYWVNIARNNPHPITAGLPDFEVVSEQYYLHVDPGVNVLATTPFPTPGVDGPHVQNPCQMPTVYTKYFGAAKVFYNALGHHADVIEAGVPRELMRRGFLWAAKGVGL